MTEMVTVEIPSPIIKRLQMIVDFGISGYDSLEEYIRAALIKDIEITLGIMEATENQVKDIIDKIRKDITDGH